MSYEDRVVLTEHQHLCVALQACVVCENRTLEVAVTSGQVVTLGAEMTRGIEVLHGQFGPKTGVRIGSGGSAGPPSQWPRFLCV